MTKNIGIMVVDDHPIVRDGLCGLIKSTPGMELAGEASNGVEAVLKALELQPDVILMDLVMPEKSGLEAIREIMGQNPGARILVLTSFTDKDEAARAIRAGALGYILKDTRSRELIKAIRDVAKGEPSIDQSIAYKLLSRDNASPETTLTRRETDVLILIAQGLSNQEIAERLFVAEGSVRTYVTNILSKLKLKNRTQAALYAIRKGLVKIDLD